MRRLHISIQTSDGKRARQAIADHFPFRLGRQLDNDLPIPFTSISGRHLSIDLQGEQILVTDLGSTNGTFIGTHRLSSHHPTAVAQHHPLRIGDLTLNMHLVDASNEPYTTAQSATSLHQQVHHALDESDASELQAFFEILSGPGSGRRFALGGEARITLGGSREASICLPDASLPDQVATVHTEASRYILTPLGTAELLLDQQPVQSPTPVASGARLQIGSCELLLYDPLEALVAPRNLPSPASRPTVNLSEEQTAPPPTTDSPAPETSPPPPEPDAAPARASTERKPTALSLSAPARPRLGLEHLLLAGGLVLFAATGALLWAFL
ncbi:hypothetical protein DL240_18245 [Lujinxingia litoralis]|uniref:FHA domain-containing protein n=1 Tax=Lujinxingia litoralis TaxID=2211119 RepID=A0A328C1J3_9DELT|nr:FHA domain-containing protein [Lujinxingia litoralis]RAL20159.1 hypothetical protein DL240_18245 [Lujinxingia litoralis]